jgi:hypothetical protein
VAFLLKTKLNYEKNDHDIVFFRRKSKKIEENCGHNIDPYLFIFKKIVKDFISRVSTQICMHEIFCRRWT